jgi:hypothetical protein
MIVGMLPGYDPAAGRAYPVVYVIQGYTGHVAMRRNRSAIRFELFDATHGGIDYRYPLSLAWLCERIAGE